MVHFLFIVIVLKICTIYKIVNNRNKVWVYCISSSDNTWTPEGCTDWTFEKFESIPMLQILWTILDIISKFYPGHDAKP